MKIRLLYQRETARSFIRGIAIGSVLAQRGHDIVFGAAEPAPNYPLTILVDWTAPLPNMSGKVIWDLPEGVYPDKIEARNIAVANEHDAMLLKRLAYNVRVLPSLIPTSDIHQIKGVQFPEPTIGIFGWSEIDAFLPFLQDKRVVTNQDAVVKVLPLAIRINDDFASYIAHLKGCAMTICARRGGSRGDGIWARNALYLGIPVLTSPGYPVEYSSPLLMTHIDFPADTEMSSEEMIRHRDRLANEWGIHARAKTWLGMVER